MSKAEISQTLSLLDAMPNASPVIYCDTLVLRIGRHCIHGKSGVDRYSHIDCNSVVFWSCFALKSLLRCKKSSPFG